SFALPAVGVTSAEIRPPGMVAPSPRRLSPDDPPGRFGRHTSRVRPSAASRMEPATARWAHPIRSNPAIPRKKGPIRDPIRGCAVDGSTNPRGWDETAAGDRAGRLPSVLTSSRMAPVHHADASQSRTGGRPMTEGATIEAPAGDGAAAGEVDGGRRLPSLTRV